MHMVSISCVNHIKYCAGFSVVGLLLGVCFYLHGSRMHSTSDWSVMVGLRGMHFLSGYPKGVMRGPAKPRSHKSLIEAIWVAR